MPAYKNSGTLVIGLGIAGTTLALTLAARGQRITAISDPARKPASLAAAGILNPVTGKRLTKSWLAESLLPEARAFYRDWEQRLGTPFLEDLPIIRLLKDQAERARWQRRKNDPAYQAFLGEEYPPGHWPAMLNDEHGSFAINGAAALDVASFLTAARAWLERHAQVIDTPIRPQSIDPASSRCNLDGTAPLQARTIIFCEGWHAARHNPWFGYLPFRPAKGEILSVRLPQPLPRVIFNQGKWLYPQNGYATLGSTWSWDNLDDAPTPAGRSALLRSAATFADFGPAPRTHGYRAGVRPTTADSRPFLGRHPHHPRLAILNGLGSKGALYAPGMARRLADHLLHDTPLPPEADIARHAPNLEMPHPGET